MVWTLAECLDVVSSSAVGDWDVSRGVSEVSEWTVVVSVVVSHLCEAVASCHLDVGYAAPTGGMSDVDDLSSECTSLTGGICDGAAVVTNDVRL